MILTNLIRVVLFIGALLLFKLSGRVLLAVLFAFAPEMVRANMLATLFWMVGYLYLSAVALGLAFKIDWIKVKFVLISSCIGLFVSVSHLYKLDCSTPDVQENTFLFLNCSAHPIEWVGIVVSVLLIALCIVRLNCCSELPNAS